MFRRTLSYAFAVLTLTLALAGPAHAAPAGKHSAHGSFWSQALSWFLRQIPQGGLMDPNGNH
jgi:hypothetical protein